MGTRTVLVTCLAVGSWLTLAFPGVAQRDTFSDEIAVTEVQVAVRVLHDGRPVQGLTAADFILEDRGEPQEISAFSVVDLESESGIDTGETSASAPGSLPAVRRNFLFFFDFWQTPARFLLRALDGVRDNVASLQPTDHVAVGFYRGGSRLITGFSVDREETDLALDVIRGLLDTDRKRTAGHVEMLAARRAHPVGQSPAERLRVASQSVGRSAALAMFSDPSVAGTFSIDQRIIGGGGGTEISALETSRAGPAAAPTAGGVGRVVSDDPASIGSALSQAAELSNLRNFTRSMTGLVTLLRDLPGQNHIVFLSQGLNASLQDARVTRLFEEMLAGFRRSGWTFQAIDVSGVPNPFERAGFAAGDLFYLANETGGELVENFNNIAVATERIRARTSVTYLLTFRPRNLLADGTFHRLKVELAKGRRGRVIHRSGYYAPKPHAERGELESQMDSIEAILGGREVADLDASLLAAPTPPATVGGLATVPVVISVDGESLLAEVDDKDETLELEIQVYALDEAGGVHDLFTREAELELKRTRRTLAAGGLRVMGRLRLAPGVYQLRSLVHSHGGRQMALASHRLEVADVGPGPVLLPPLFIDPPESRWLVSRRGGLASADARIFDLGGQPFVPAVDPPVAADGISVCVLLGDLDVQLHSRVLDHNGVEVAGGRLDLLQRVEAGDGYERLVGRFLPEGLADGRYRLEVTAVGRTSGERATASSGFRIGAKGSS